MNLCGGELSHVFIEFEFRELENKEWFPYQIDAKPKGIYIFMQSNYSEFYLKIYWFTYYSIFLFLQNKVPRKVLKERFESTPELDEPLRTDLEDHDDDNLYEDDQFYKESEAIPPAPKQQRPTQPEVSFIPATPSVAPPLHAIDDNTLDGKCFFISVWLKH